MSEPDFFDAPADQDEKTLALEQIKSDRKKSSSIKLYADESKVEQFTDNAFDLELEKKRVIDSLNELKELSVEEFTFKKKYEEIQESQDYKMFQNAGQFKAKIWSPTDLNNEELTIQEISELNPEIVIVSEFCIEDSEMWSALRLFCHTAEYNQAPGRFFKILLRDVKTGKYLGFASIASEVIAISCRDEWLGWTQEDKLEHKMLRHSAIGTTIAATQPFGSNFLGGKLMAAMLTTDKIRNHWFDTYGDVLAGLTTTSLYGTYSMYNSHKWWKPVGKTKGKIPLKSSEKSYEIWHGWLKRYKADKYNEMMTQKEGVSGPVTGAKMRVLNMIFEQVGVKQSDYTHGFERGVYYSCFYENTKEFFQRKVTDKELVLKPLIAGDVKSILDWWKPKAIERYKKLKLENRLNPEKLFYDDLQTISWEAAKEKYMAAVGANKEPENNK